MKKERNELVEFLVGIVMLAAGVYWFTTSVTVTSGFYSLRFGGMSMGGLVVVPFIVGICWVFANPDSLGGKLVAVVGLFIILASVIVGTHFVFKNRNLYEYLIMLILICGGASLTLKVLLAKPKDEKTRQKSSVTKRDDYDQLERDLDELKNKIK